MIVSIHQPNFLPWMPFFEKIKKSDIFIILRHCDFEKNNFQNRFIYEGVWNTMSVKSKGKKIVDKRYANPYYDWVKIKKRLFNKDLSIFDECISESLFETNSNIIQKCCSVLNIKTEIVLDYKTDLLRTDRLLDLCQNYGATTYLCGPSGKNYLETDKFTDNSIKIEHFSYTRKEHFFEAV